MEESIASFRLAGAIAEVRELHFELVGDNPETTAVFEAEAIRILGGDDAKALAPHPPSSAQQIRC